MSSMNEEKSIRYWERGYRKVDTLNKCERHTQEKSDDYDSSAADGRREGE